MEENTPAFKDMAAQLAAILRVEEEKGWEAWSQLHGKLAEVASMAGDKPTTAVQALLKVANDASSPQAFLERLSLVKHSLLKGLVCLVADELNMTPLGDSEPVHIIDEESNFCGENVDWIIKRSAELSVRNAPYAVVSIVGAQSSGKSYLLNRLFGTKFQVMQAGRRRSQTTRGIMISTCIRPSLLVLDVEGFNGRERGKDTTFEKQAALFALTISDLMMVNMSVFDVGLEHGGATELFKTLFQERAKLPPGLTKILVVLRHYDGETTLENLRSDVMESLEEIWESANQKSVKFMDYIEVNVVALPEKISPEFPKEVALLRKKLSNIRSAEVQATDFSLSSRMIWNDIKENKELDIPSHQVSIATIKCRDIAEEILKSINYWEEYKLLTAEEYVGSFKEIAHELLEKIKTKYNLNTERYDTKVRNMERQHMVEGLHKIIKNVSTELASKVLQNTFEQFKSQFPLKNINAMKDAGAGLSKYVDEFMISCEDLNELDSDYLSKLRAQLETQLSSYADQEIKMEGYRNQPTYQPTGGYRYIPPKTNGARKSRTVKILRSAKTAMTVATVGVSLLVCDFEGVMDGIHELTSAAQDHDFSEIPHAVHEIHTSLNQGSSSN